MQYDGYNPFGFAPNESKVEIEKKIKRKKRTMASIHQYKALSDPINIAKPKDNMILEGIDKELHTEGVRPGQVWQILHGKDIYFLSFIGYHEKGFLMLNLRGKEQKPIPAVSLFKYPRKIKMDLLSEIKNKKAILLSTVIPTLIDKNGEALPNREMDVTLAAMMTRPAFWHDHNNNRNYFLSICKNGHHRISIGYLPSGQECDHFCFNAQHTEAMSLLTDIILNKVYYGKDNISEFDITYSESVKFSSYSTAWTYIESIYDTYRILGANKTGIPRNKFIPFGIEESPDDWRVKTRKWLVKNKIKSGDIFFLNHTNEKNSFFSNKEIKIRFHRRLCGNLHVELSENDFFKGETDCDLLKTIYEENTKFSIQLSQETKIKVDQNYIFVKCPYCSSNEPILCISEDHLDPFSDKIKNIEPIIIKKPEIDRTASPGDIVQYHGKPVLYLKKNTEEHNSKIMILKHNKKITTIPIRKISTIKQSQKNKEIFFDKNNLLKKNFPIEKWYKSIVPGSKIRIHPLVENESLRDLAGFIVTATEFPFESDGRPSIGIIESDNIVKLDTDVLPCFSFPIEKEMYFKIEDKELSIKEISKDKVIMDNDISLPLAGFLFALSRKKIEIAQINTVDKLLENL